MAGEAAADKPFAVEGAGHRLKETDTPLTAFRQLVIGCQDTRDPSLLRKGRNDDFNLRERSLVDDR